MSKGSLNVFLNGLLSLLFFLGVTPSTYADDYVASQIPPLTSNVENDRYMYDVRVLDTNSDGIDDLYVTGGYGRTIPDFVVELGTTCGTYSLNSSPTSAQRIAALQVDSSEKIALTRADLSGDAIFDFYFENVGDEVAGACDLIVTTTFGQGGSPSKLIEFTSDFLQLVEQVDIVLEYAADVLELYNASVAACQTIYIPVLVYDPFLELYYLQYQYIQLCQSGAVYLQNNTTPNLFSFIQSLSALDTRYALNGMVSSGSVLYGEVVTAVDPQKLIKVVNNARNAVRWVRVGAVAASAVIIADDVTVVGVVDDPALIGTLAAFGLAVIADVALGTALDALEAAVEEGNPDVGHIESVEGEEAGRFAIPDGCMPEDPTQNSAPDVDSGDSGRLTDNMKNAGCWCFDAAQGGRRNQAHHIFPKKGGGVFQELRDCLDDLHKIDIDSALNGVCLPASEAARDAAESNALLHRGSGGVQHSVKVAEGFLSKCQNLSSSDLKAYMRQVAESYTKGLPPPP